MRIAALIALALLAAGPARAQDALPRAVADRVTATLNDPMTELHEGDARIEPGRIVDNDLAVIGGDLVLGGRVGGDVVVLNGTLTLEPGADVGGEVIVVGGAVSGETDARVAGELRVFAEPVSYCRMGARVSIDPAGCTGGPLADAGPGPADDDGAPAMDDQGWNERSGGRARFLVSAGRSYNRVEGLPVRFGPAVETGGSNPLRVRALAVFRTESGPELGPDQWGYDARIEQFFGGRRALRAGVRAYSVVDPIESYHLTDLENSLSTFFLHRDYRDHYQREGWTAYAAWAPRGSPLSATVEYRAEDHGSVAPGSPWTLFDNEDPWRAQPLVGQGRLHSVAGAVEVDTRSEAWDPSTGWFVRAELEQAVDSDLRRPAGFGNDFAAGGPPPVAAAAVDEHFLAGSVDIRRYNRVNAVSRLNLRLLAGGSLNGADLPPQRQHALGGEGTLPAYPLFALDCGARTGTMRLPEDAEPFYPRYGCDGFALFQAEYRGDVTFHLDPFGWDGDDEDEEGWTGGWNGIGGDLGWVFFVDAGTGWRRGSALDDNVAVDVGAGILLGDLGIYVAAPVGGERDRGDLNFFIRLAPRF